MHADDEMHLIKLVLSQIYLSANNNNNITAFQLENE
jgi:hypothetical protein